MSVKAFSPTDVSNAAKDFAGFPEEVIQVVNGLLVERGRSTKYITITQDEVIDRLKQLFEEKGLPFSRRDSFDRHWLDFEEAYRAIGWDIYYDKPGYNESYDPYWRFSPKS